MRSLLDVNVLLALFDTEHTGHARARDWLDGAIADGWASCPITQAGFVRLISGPRYPKPVATPQAVAMIDKATGTPFHEFWADDLSLASPAIQRTRLLSHNQVTDVYLLALAVAHRGRLVTLDRRISLAAVAGANPDNLVTI